jgi:membrane fusion protein (multidrug efflux system)
LRMKKRMLIMLICAGVIFGGIFGYQAFKARMIKKFMSAGGQQKQTVSTYSAAMQEWRPQFIAVGSLTAVLGADLAPEVNGIIKQIYFKSGSDVKKGVLLVEINADSELARLESLKALEDLAAKTLARDREQFKVQAVSQATIDTDTANLKSAQAQVHEQQALIEKKFIRAPFDGRLGIRLVDIGQYLNPGQKIVTLQSLDPIFVDFYLPQKDVSRVKVGQKVKLKVDAYPDGNFTGEISAISSKVDQGTRNVPVRATVPNPGKKLLPGMFTTVSVDMGGSRSYITLPQTAISYNPYGDYVYVVSQNKDAEGKPQLIVKQRLIDTGDTRGDQIAVLKGVKQGETVVIAGQNKLKNNTPVEINNSVKLTNEASPEPVDE